MVINLPGAPNPRYIADLRQADALVADGWAAAHLPAILGRAGATACPKGVDADRFRPDGPNAARARFGSQDQHVIVIGRAPRADQERCGCSSTPWRCVRARRIATRTC